jgi:hypothetical protein
LAPVHAAAASEKITWLEVQLCKKGNHHHHRRHMNGSMTILYTFGAKILISFFILMNL